MVTTEGSTPSDGPGHTHGRRSETVAVQPEEGASSRLGALLLLRHSHSMVAGGFELTS